MSSATQIPATELLELCPAGFSTRGKANIAVVAVLLPLAFFMVTVRLFVRKKITRALWWDDLALVIALLFYIPTSAISIVETRIGSGKHVFCLDLPTISRSLRLGLVVEVMLSFCIVFPRLAIAILVFRVFAISKKLRMVLYFYSTFMVIIMCSTAGTLSAFCTPREKFWNPLMPGTCWSRTKMYAVGYLNGSVSIFSDFFLAFLPVVFLRNMQMSLKKKIGLTVLMGLGLLTGVFSIMRTYYFPKLFDEDFIYDAAPLLIFTNLESGVAIIAAAIPALWPLIARHVSSSRRSPRVSPPEVSPPQNDAPLSSQTPQDGQRRLQTGRLWKLPRFTFEGKSRMFSSIGWISLGSEKAEGNTMTTDYGDCVTA